MYNLILGMQLCIIKLTVHRCDFHQYNSMPRENHYQKCTEVPRATEKSEPAHSAVFTNYIPLLIDSAFAIILANILSFHIPKNNYAFMIHIEKTKLNVSPLKATVTGGSRELLLSGLTV